MSITVVIVPIVAVVIALVTYLDNRNEKRQKEVKDEIKESVDHLSTVLSERLETKENVNQIKVQIAELRSSITQGAQARFEQLERELGEIRRKVY